MTNAELRERKVMLAINRMLDAQRSFAVHGASEIEWPARWVSEAADLLADAAELERWEAWIEEHPDSTREQFEAAQLERG